MNLESVEATDFLCFESLSVPLKDQGLACLLGNNLDSDAANSNGSGKSSIFKAISWCLFGQTVDGLRYDEVIRKGASTASVTVRFRHRTWSVEGTSEGVWSVLRERKKGKPFLQLSNGDGPVSAPVEGLQAQIESMIGMDFDAFRNTVLYGQGDAARFADPRTTDSTRKEMLFKILRLGVLTRCHEIASERRKELARVINDREMERSQLMAKIDGIGAEALQVQLDRWETERQLDVETKLETARELIAEARVLLKEPKVLLEPLRAKLAKFEAPYHPVGAAELDLGKLRKAIEGRAMGLQIAEMDLSALLAQRAEIDNALSRLDGDLCPICTSPLDAGAPAELRKGLEERRAETFSREEILLLDIDAKRQASDEAKQKLDDELAKSRLRVKAAEAQVAQERELRNKIEGLIRKQHEAETRKTRASELMRAANARREAENPFAELIVLANQKIEEVSSRMDALQADNDFDRQELSHVEFWVKGFSPKGLPSYILDRVMVILTDRANHYLQILSDGDIQIGFSTQKELKSKKGEVRDEICISWKIEGHEGVQPSGGQWKKIEIATDLALMDLVAAEGETSCQILLLDEVLDGLDMEGRRRVVQLLRELRERKETVLVISHEPDLLDEFEQVFTVTKKNGVSVLEIGGSE